MTKWGLVHFWLNLVGSLSFAHFNSFGLPVWIVLQVGTLLGTRISLWGLAHWEVCLWVWTWWSVDWLLGGVYGRA